MIAEGLDGRPPEHRSRRPLEEDVGRRVGDLHPQVVGQADDADADQVRQVGQVPEPLLEGELGRLGPALEPADVIDDRVAAGGALGRGPAIVGQPVGDGIERPATGQGDTNRDGNDDGLGRHEGHDDVGVHGRSIA